MVAAVTVIERAAHKTQRFAGMAVILTGFAIVLWGLALLALQVLYWLKTNQWLPVAALTLFTPPPYDWAIDVVRFHPYDLVPSFAHNKWAWLAQPNDWLGVYTIVAGFLKLISLSFALVVAGIATWFAGIVIRFLPWGNETR